VVADGDALGVWTVRDSFKVKRIRRNPVVTVAPCTFRGRLLGPAIPGRAEIVDATGAARIRTAIVRKYRLTGWLSLLGSRLRRGTAGTVGIRIVLGKER
jgi:PPOX class probable F420-dependent enzyme